MKLGGSQDDFVAEIFRHCILRKLLLICRLLSGQVSILRVFLSTYLTNHKFSFLSGQNQPSSTFMAQVLRAGCPFQRVSLVKHVFFFLERTSQKGAKDNVFLQRELLPAQRERGCLKNLLCQLCLASHVLEVFLLVALGSFLFLWWGRGSFFIYPQLLLPSWFLIHSLLPPLKSGSFLGFGQFMCSDPR